MQKNELLIGTRHRLTNRHIGSYRKCSRITIRAFVKNGIDGLTIYKGDGVFRSVIERTLRVVIYSDEVQAIRNTVHELLILLHQEEIYFNGQPVRNPVA